MSNKIAFINGKGGVGKTTGVFHVAGVLSKMGEKALVVDFDKQRNATSTLLMNNEVGLGGFSAFDALMGRCHPRDAVAAALFQSRGNAAPKHYGVSCMRGDARFGGLTMKGLGAKGAAFGNCLDAYAEAEGIGWVLVDMPPSNAAVNDLCFAHVADYVIVPFSSDVYSVQGYGDIMETVAKARSANPRLNVLGIYLSRFGRGAAQSWVRDKLLGFGDVFIDVQIPYAADIMECAILGSPISYYKNSEKSSSRRAYERLVDEIIRRVADKIVRVV